MYLTGCKKESHNIADYTAAQPRTENPIYQSSLHNLNDYYFVGDEHNNKLDRLRGYLERKTQLDQSIRLSNKPIFDDFSTELEGLKLFVQDGLSMETFFNHTCDIRSYIDNSQLFPNSIEQYVYQVLDAFKNELFEHELVEIQSAFRNDPNLIPEEVIALEIGISVAQRSSFYWHNNFYTWRFEENHSLQERLSDLRACNVCDNIGENDFIGAVGGAIAGGVLGAGVGAVPTGLATGFGASAATGVYYGGKWIFDKIGDNTGWW